MDDRIIFKKPFKYIMLVFWLSLPIFLIVSHGLRFSDQQFKENIISGIENETEILTKAFDDQLKDFIYEILRKNEWNRNAAAAQMGIHPTTLWRKIKRLNLKIPQQDGRSRKK